MRTKLRVGGLSRARIAVAGLVASAVAVFLACGSTDLTETQSCERRGGSCVPLGPNNEIPDCPVVKGVRDVPYLDSCFCCAPPEEAGTTPVVVVDAGAPTQGDDDDDAATGGDASGDDAGETDGAATDASDAAIQDAAADG